MTFEEKKQQIIENLQDLLDMPYWGDTDYYQNELIAKIKKLQPDKPTCSTCKYLMQNHDELWCGFEDVPVREFYSEFNPQKFGCIYHDKT